MSPSRTSQVLLALSLSVLALAAGCKRRSTLAPATDYAQPLRMDFRPPVERALTETLAVSSRVQRAGESEPAAADELTLTTESRFRPDRQAWVLTQRTTDVQLRRGGAPVPAPLASLLQRMPLRVQLAGDGAFVRVLDAEAREQEVAESGLDPAAQEALLQVLEPDVVQQRVGREWTAKYGGLFGRNLRLGQKLYALDAVVLADGGSGRELAYVLERTLSGTLLTEHGEALVFTLRCLGQVPPDAPGELRALLAAPGVPALEPSVSCEGEQVLARGAFVPVRSHLRVQVSPAGGDGGAPAGTWTVQRSARTQSLEK
jgi:hypothetical protein